MLRELGEMVRKLPGFLYRKTRDGGVIGAAQSLTIQGVKRGSVAVNEQFGPIGTPVWDLEWDVLVILDACRVDLMRQVAGEYDFVGSPDAVDTVWSVGSKSNEWMERTFAADYRDEIERSAYVTGNPYSAKVDFEAEPAVLDEVWRDAWSDEHSTILPRPLTDRAIATWRNGAVDRLIVHYMQPHAPFVDHPEIGSYGDPEDFGRDFGDIWARAGDDIPFERIWPAYRDNLRLVMDDLNLLLDSVDADVAITADHGNAMGELGFTGHGADVMLPGVRRVPWVRTSGRDTGEYVPEVDRRERDVDAAVNDRLRQLGYTE
jgi:hypothetical protein